MITTPALGLLLAAAGPEPSPSPTEPAMTIYTVTPGISGFIAFFVLAMVGWLLFRSLVKQMRKVDRAAARREESAAQVSAVQVSADEQSADRAASEAQASSPDESAR